MTPRRSSPVRALLSFGTCLALATPAAASPAGFEFPEWPVAKPGRAKPVKKPRARKSAPVAAPQADAARPEASAAEDASGEVAASPEASAAESNAAGPEASAAESTASSEVEARPDASAAGAVETGPDASAAGSNGDGVATEPTSEATPAIVGPAPAVALAIPGREAARAERARRVAAAQVLTGAVLTAGGLVGAGVMASGLYLHRSAERELARGAAGGYPDELLAPLYTQRQRGETMLAAGAVAGALGLAVGVALLATGARDLKAARARQMARLRVAPTVGGVVFSGRF